MALPPLPASNTERWWCIYTNNNTTHRMGIRTIDGVTNVQASTVFGDIWTRLGLQINSTAVVGLERALKNSDVRIPFAYTGPPPTGGGTQQDNDRRARFLTFTGRSIDGRKSKLFIFGAVDISEGDYRVDTTESSVILSIVTLLNSAQDVFLSISGAQPVWHAYCNINYHDHWVKIYRKG